MYGRQTIIILASTDLQKAHLQVVKLMFMPPFLTEVHGQEKVLHALGRYSASRLGVLLTKGNVYLFGIGLKKPIGLHYANKARGDTKQILEHLQRLAIL